MADVSIDSTTSAFTYLQCRSVAFSNTDPNIGYWFYFDSGNTLSYSKTTDGGATWGAAVVIHASVTSIYLDIWPDWWTPGDTGTLIHIFYFEATNKDLYWISLDTSTDTLGTAVLVANLASDVATVGTFVSGTKTRTGYLYCAYQIDAGIEKGLVRSTDNGATWSASLATTFIEATVDRALLFPASNTGDNNDCWALYHDASTNALTLKMWDSSAGSATESATILTLVEGATGGTSQIGFSGAVRNSDGHLIVAAVSERDAATSDHLVYDINGTGSITALTAITTDIDDHYHPAVFIDQNTNDIYVAYNGKRDGSETLDTSSKVYYTKSTDDGTSWSAGDTAYMEGAADAVAQVWAPLTGSRFYVGWRVGTTLVGNAVNSIDVSIAINATVGASTWAGKATLVNVTIVDSVKGASTWAGITSPLSAYGVFATIGSSVWAGTTANLATLIQATKGASTWLGKTSSISTGGSISSVIGASTWAGISSNLAHQIVATKGTSTWVGKTSIVGATVTSLRSWRIVKYDTATSKKILVTGLTSVKYYLYDPSTGLTMDLSDNTFKAYASCVTPKGTMVERDATNYPGWYDYLLSTTGLSGLYQENSESYGTDNYFSENPVRFQDGVEYLGGLTIAEAASLTAVELATDTLEASMAALPSAAQNATAVLSAATTTPIAADVKKVAGVTIDGTGTTADPWGPA